MSGVIPAQITVFEDRTFTLHHQDAARVGAAEEGRRRREGLGEPEPRQGRARCRRQQVREIAEVKQADLNAHDLEHATRIIEGTARSMGLNVN